MTRSQPRQQLSNPANLREGRSTQRFFSATTQAGTCKEKDMFESYGRRTLTSLAMTTLILSFTLFGVAAEPAPSKAQAKYEISFMTGMIDHHEMAIMMAQMCLEKAVHEELRSLCEQIIATQTQEQQMMQQWLQSWYGVSYSPQMSNSMMKQMEKMASLSGAEFEIEFLQSMTRHHWKAVIEGSQCVDKAYHQELIELCEDIVLAQTAEIRQMQEWLCQWYSICDYGPEV